MIYSHDSFGLGHLRRCRRIANWLVEQDENITVLIISGSPIIGNYEFRSRVDFVRVPGVIKLRNGDYTPLSLRMGIEQTLALRASIIQHTAEAFAPDVFIVDKEPQGLRGEVVETLKTVRAMGCKTVLGLRDVMDAPETLDAEWQRKGALPVLETLYDHIWVYGLEDIYHPLAGLDISEKIRNKVTFTGYLPDHDSPRMGGGYEVDVPFEDQPFLLVTPGGGGDGAEMVDWTVSAYEHAKLNRGEALNLLPALVVYGPFMPQDTKDAFDRRIAKLSMVEAIDFEPRLEQLITQSSGVVAMGGYNTFCEVMSFDRPALIIPRTVPRREQIIRASHAEKLGLVSMLADDGIRNPERMLAALQRLPHQAPPSLHRPAGLLSGLETMAQEVKRIIDQPAPEPLIPDSILRQMEAQLKSLVPSPRPFLPPLSASPSQPDMETPSPIAL